MQLGGSDNDDCLSLIEGREGEVWMAGATASAIGGNPAPTAFSPWLLKVNANGTLMQSIAFYGGYTFSGFSQALIAVDELGNTYTSAKVQGSFFSLPYSGSDGLLNFQRCLSRDITQSLFPRHDPDEEGSKRYTHLGQVSILCLN